MTVIAAVTDGRTVWLASDNAGSNNGLLVTAPKVRRYGEGASAFLVGTAGDRSAGALFHRVQVDAVPNPASDDDCDAWAQVLAEAWTAVVDEQPLGPWRSATPENPGMVDAVALVGYAGRIYRLSSNLAVRVEQEFAAIGAGCDFAYGAFHAAAEAAGGWHPYDRLALAVDAALTWCAHCHPPMRALCLDYPDDPTTLVCTSTTTPPTGGGFAIGATASTAVATATTPASW